MTVHVHGDYEWIEEPGHQSRCLTWVRECKCGYSPDRPAWRVLVTGSRSLNDPGPVHKALLNEYRAAQSLGLRMVVVEGQCPYGGADKFAEEWATGRAFVDHDPMPANWKALGKQAGPYRNQQMVDSGADVCLAFPTIESRGTWDCCRRAEEAGIPVKVFEQ